MRQPLQTVERPLRGLPTEGMQPPARALRAHLWAEQYVFRGKATQNMDPTLFRACGRETLRGLFDTLKRSCLLMRQLLERYRFLLTSGKRTEPRRPSRWWLWG